MTSLPDFSIRNEFYFEATLKPQEKHQLPKRHSMLIQQSELGLTIDMHPDLPLLWEQRKSHWMGITGPIAPLAWLEIVGEKPVRFAGLYRFPPSEHPVSWVSISPKVEPPASLRGAVSDRS